MEQNDLNKLIDDCVKQIVMAVLNQVMARAEKAGGELPPAKGIEPKMIPAAEVSEAAMPEPENAKKISPKPENAMTPAEVAKPDWNRLEAVVKYNFIAGNSFRKIAETLHVPYPTLWAKFHDADWAKEYAKKKKKAGGK